MQIVPQISKNIVQNSSTHAIYSEKFILWGGWGIAPSPDPSPDGLHTSFPTKPLGSVRSSVQNSSHDHAYG